MGECAQGGVMQFLVTVGLMLSLICGFAPQIASAVEASAPQFTQFSADVALDRFPLVAENKAMSTEEAKRLALKLEVLQSDLAAWNFYRGLGKTGAWKYETLRAGTVVAVDATGRPWYKGDCSNRLYVPAKCPECMPAAAVIKPLPVPLTVGPSGSAQGGISSSTSSSWFDLGQLSDFFIWLFWLLVLLALLALLLLASAWLLIRAYHRLFPPPAPPTPVPAHAQAPAPGPPARTRPAHPLFAPVPPAPDPQPAPIAPVPPVPTAVPQAPPPIAPAQAPVVPPVPNPEQVPAPAPAVHGDHAVAACIANLALQRVRDITELELNNDGSVSFRAVTRE